MSTKWKASGLLVVAILLAGPLLCGAQDIRALATNISQHIAASGRKSVGVVDFTNLDGNPTELGRYLAEEFSDALFGEAKGFEVIDRTHLRAILQEHKLATTGLINPSTAKVLGQFAGVDTLVTGTITPFEEHVHISLKVLDTETAKLLAADTVDIARTKTISDLIGPGVAGTPSLNSGSMPEGGNPGQAHPSVSLPAAVFSNELLFTPRGCKDKGGTVACLFTVTDKADSNLRTLMSSQTFMVDDQGNQYNGTTISFGGYTVAGVGCCASSDLIPDVPANLVVEVANVPRAAQTMNAALAYQAGAYNGKVVIRGIPISRAGGAPLR